MFDDHEFLEVAGHLRRADSREGFQRSAVSRAYYSAFLLARRVFRARDVIPQSGGGSDHRAVADALRDIDEALAAEYRALRRLRNLADYSVDEIDSDELEEQARYAIDAATLIRTELERIA